MEDNQGHQDSNSPTNHGGGERNTSEPVRSRWTPKPEQILILESIFNSGMVNPPKEETVRIRKLLEKFGSVGDANVFYWFQNRRSRSRRRQRQMQATLASQQAQASGHGGAIHYENTNTNSSMGFPNSCFASPSSNYLVGNSTSSSSSSSSSSCGGGGVAHDQDHAVETLFSISNHMGGFHELDHTTSMTSILCPSEPSNLQFQAGFITVFINGVATEVPRGPLDMRAMFGQDVLLLYSSGLPVPTNEFGLLMQSLQHGESYFLVSRPT